MISNSKPRWNFGYSYRGYSIRFYFKTKCCILMFINQWSIDTLLCGIPYIKMIQALLVLTSFRIRSSKIAWWRFFIKQNTIQNINVFIFKLDQRQKMFFNYRILNKKIKPKCQIKDKKLGNNEMPKRWKIWNIYKE